MLECILAKYANRIHIPRSEHTISSFLFGGEKIISVFYLFIPVIPDEMFHLMTNENGCSDIVCCLCSVEKYGEICIFNAKRCQDVVFNQINVVH